jgi:prevent-host-death family protein
MSMNNVHGHKETEIPAGEFKQRCLALLDQVSESGIPIVVTKRGRPVARVVPIEATPAPIAGSLRVLTENEGELFTTGETWDAERSG